MGGDKQELGELHAGFSFCNPTVNSSSHAASLSAVLAGRANLAAIDAVTWRLISRDTDDADGLRILTKTRPTQSLPYIAGLREDILKLFHATAQAISNLSSADRKYLMLTGLVSIPEADYLSLPTPGASFYADSRTVRR